MKILVLGAGVIGTSTAWYLAARGHEVTVVDRREGAGLETSFANGGQISACHAEPWANPGAPAARSCKWLGATTRRCSSACAWTPRNGRGGCASCANAAPWRTRANIARDREALALYSRAALQELRAATGIEYDAAGARHPALLHRPARVRARRRGGVRCMQRVRARPRGEDARRGDRDRARARRGARDASSGATYTAVRRVGRRPPVHARTSRALAAGEGRALPLRPRRSRACGRRAAGCPGVAVRDAAGRDETLDRRRLRGGARQLFAAAHPPHRRATSRSIPRRAIRSPCRSPIRARRRTVSLTDDGAKLVYLAPGRPHAHRRHRGALGLLDRPQPGALRGDRCGARARCSRARATTIDATFWTGLRPSTPSNVPARSARTRFANLYLNTGHGTLGWTWRAAARGAALADIISGRKPERAIFPYDHPMTPSNASKTSEAPRRRPSRATSSRPRACTRARSPRSPARRSTSSSRTTSSPRRSRSAAR